MYELASAEYVIEMSIRTLSLKNLKIYHNEQSAWSGTQDEILCFVSDVTSC